MPGKILIVDDNEDLRSELADLLDAYDVVEAGSAEGALNLLNRANDIGCVILDVMMPGKSGLDILGEIKKKNPRTGVMILTGHSSKDIVIEALKAGADDYAEKPINIPEFRELIGRMMAAANGEPEVSSLDLAGKMAKVRDFIQNNCYKKTSLEDAASAVRVSPKYLSRVFKEHAGIGFNDFKLKVKTEKAVEMLVGTGHTVEQISGKLGYENSASFIRQFKKITGRTPASYRKHSRGKKAPTPSGRKGSSK